MTQQDRGYPRRRPAARAVWERLRDTAWARQNRHDGNEPEDVADATTYRAMDLALRVGELLLGSGEATESVNEAMRSLSVAYGLPRSEASVTFTAISLSCTPPGDAPPVTGERSVRRRVPDYARLVATHQLVEEAALGLVELDEAFERLRAIKKAPLPYPPWLNMIALPLVAATASVLGGGDAVVFAVAFLAALASDRVAAFLASRGIAEFFQLAVAAAIGSLLASALVMTGLPVQASAVVTGAITALLPGRPLVASVQDGISGSFVSSSARLLEVFFIVAALAAGVGLTVYTAVRLGLPFSGADLPTAISVFTPFQILAAVGMSVTFAISLSVPPKALPTAAVGGAAIFAAYQVLRHFGMMPVLSAAIAATVVGLAGHMMARRHRAPSMPYTVPLIGPLLPGTALYRGLLEISKNDLNNGLLSLFSAIATAFALAAGISLARELVRGGGIGVSPRRRQAARRTRGY